MDDQRTDAQTPPPHKIRNPLRVRNRPRHGPFQSMFARLAFWLILAGVAVIAIAFSLDVSLKAALGIAAISFIGILALFAFVAGDW